jgi:hypothetical protein
VHRNARSIAAFYQSLDQGDGEAMAATYHPDATFQDPVFRLKGSDVGDMWRMFCSSGASLRVEYSSVSADDRTGTAHWEAFYTYLPTGRQIHNVIDAKFEFDDDGLVARHRDEFNLARWSRQALGAPGLFFGWAPWVQRRIQDQAEKQLRKFQAREKGKP